jgi:predicted acylesterase/phospholipase RssA
MEALRDTTIDWKGQRKRLLDEVDIISSVSGGSFTAAYYGLHRDGLFDGTFEQTFLKRDVQGDLLKKTINPVSWFKLAGASFGRSDLAVEYHNENLFNHSTFQQLIDTGTRPFIMLNATDMTTGRQFPFIQDQFDLMCSDLAALPVARAVATSSAFPGLLTPLTYQNHAGSCDYREPRWVDLALRDRVEDPDRANVAEARRSYYQSNPFTPRRRYVHLIDGGVADNIGLRGVLDALQSTDSSYSLLRRINDEKIEKLVVILVNAGAEGLCHPYPRLR